VRSDVKVTQTDTHLQLSRGWYGHEVNRMVTIVRGGLVLVVFKKTLSAKEDTELESKSITLMISDVERVVSGLEVVHEIWASVIETGLATWLLWLQLSSSSFAMLGLALRKIQHSFLIKLLTWADSSMRWLVCHYCKVYSRTTTGMVQSNPRKTKCHGEDAGVLESNQDDKCKS
jgi:hypothetical protein